MHNAAYFALAVRLPYNPRPALAYAKPAPPHEPYLATHGGVRSRCRRSARVVACPLTCAAHHACMALLIKHADVRATSGRGDRRQPQRDNLTTCHTVTQHAECVRGETPHSLVCACTSKHK
jgi:hypothetical protein